MHIFYRYRYGFEYLVQDPFSDFQQSPEMYSRKRLHVALGISKCSKKRAEKEYFVHEERVLTWRWRCRVYNRIPWPYLRIFREEVSVTKSIISGSSSCQSLPFTIYFFPIPSCAVIPTHSVLLLSHRRRPVPAGAAAESVSPALGQLRLRHRHRQPHPLPGVLRPPEPVVLVLLLRHGAHIQLVRPGVRELGETVKKRRCLILLSCH